MRKGIFILLVVFWLGVFIVPPANSFAQMTIKKPLPLPQQNQASISAVTPKALVLQQGGPAAVVTVEGNYLETILSVLAVKGGLGFSEISVKLVQPWPASRKIELQATANAPVGRGYQLRFFGKAGLMNFRIDVPLAVFSLEVAGKPISQMQIQVPISTLPNQTQTTFMPPVTMVSPKAEIIAITPKTVSLEQGGSPAVVTVEGKYLETIQGIQVIRGGQSMRVVTTKLVQPWPASRKIELQATATAPVAKDYQLRFIGKAGREDFRIDVPLTVFSLEVVGKPTNSMQIRPDFIVTGITFNPANPTTSDRIMITVNMKNQSRAAGVIPAGALTWSANSPRGGGVGGTSYGLAIQPGATFFGGMYFVDPGEVAAGSYAVTAKVDPDNRCIEFNEDNNQLTTTLVIGAASGPLQQADMVVTEMALEPPQITTATDFRVRVTVKNQGIVAANFLPGSLILGGPDLYYQYADNNSTSFAPGESRTYRLVKGHVTAGTFTWKTIVDPGNRIKETDENNNEKSIQVTIGQPGQDTLRFQTNNQLQVEVPISTFPNQTQTTFKPPVTMVSPKAEIIAITPKTVSLEQGGSPAVVTVEGKYLETIQGIQVIQGGQSVRVITTKLVQPWPASRKIELQAGAAAPVAKNYQLRFIGKAGREDFRIDVPLAVFSLEVAGKPINQMQIQVPISTLPNQTQTTFRPPGTSLALEGTLTVTSPNGGEAWDIRESFLQRISWQSKGSVGSSVKIELYRGETKVHDIKDSSPNTGVLYWEPPNYISYATDYRIKITSLTNQLITDMSDQSFTLGILPGTKAIEVLFKGIQVIDDKDPVGPGELWFEFYVNDKLCGRKPSSQTYSINDNLTQESNIDFNDLSCTIALSEDQAVRVKVIGMDDDSPLPNESLGTAEWHESISILKNRSPYQFYTIKSEDPYCFTVTFQVWIR